MINLKKYNNFVFESISDEINSYKQEILSHRGWKEVAPKYNFWELQLEYNLTDDITIQIIKLSKSKDLLVYMNSRKRDNSQLISTYSSNYTLLFQSYNNYDRIMKICGFLLPFYIKAPSDEAIEEIINGVFVELQDIGLTSFNDELEVCNWGYVNNMSINNREWGYFPAFRITDRLCLSLLFKCTLTLDFSIIKKEFNDCKDRLNMYIDYKNVKIEERIEDYDDFKTIVIEIEI